jgi:hypothetical protein
MWIVFSITAATLIIAGAVIPTMIVLARQKNASSTTTVAMDISTKGRIASHEKHIQSISCLSFHSSMHANVHCGN